MGYGAVAAIIISLVAGLATVLGGGISIIAARHITPITFAAALAFAAGCTLTVAFADVLPEGQEAFSNFLFYRDHDADLPVPDSDQDKSSALSLLILLIGWLVATAFDKALHGSLDAYESRHRTDDAAVVHIGVCAHDHTHHTAGTHETNQGLTAPIMSESHTATQELTVHVCSGGNHCVTHSHKPSSSDASHNHGAEKSSRKCWPTIGRVLKRIVIGKSTLSESEKEALENQFRAEPEKISRLGYFTATVLALHNLPEGVALYGTATADTKAGLGLAAGIALHNLPQGMAIAVPIFVGLKSAKKALIFCAAAALAQPLGAIIGYGIVGSHPSDKIMSIMLLLTAGVLFNASLKELYGSAVRYDKGNQVSGSFMFIGMLVMSCTLIVLAYV